ncbi:NAD-glutamate dehydrogenase domain-containing protein [Marinobacterium rhizophilum]|uniref:NAD-glutamate dehydrogenase n=1 Tax=Marinobacterium rhizophilum TaxID=420402 RepID=A0ABY5HRM5_9GAMM|nr:NAD-glutamate dehydrogenase domain-containing protein [Marinobacterium rhizophilum]UTW14208.1 NAD-glutamate dehydrogenase [Marinobacterium rhizophilum]
MNQTTDASTSVMPAAASSIIEAGFSDAVPAEQGLSLRVTGAGAPMTLSTLLPMIENLGVDVLSSASSTEAERWSLELRLQTRSTQLARCTAMQQQFCNTLLAVARGDADNDGFNNLITLCGLDLRGCILLRALARYLLQIKLPFSQSYMQHALCRYPHLTTAMVAFFRLKFDPLQPVSSADLARAQQDVLAQIEAVESVDDDRIFTAFFDVICATVRTSFFHPAVWEEPSRCLAFKLLPSRIRKMPKPVPAFEIFVFGPEVEGVHLRGGKVSRGGLRWSERMEDYRTEVLGLVKAQMVKNAVIVPTGAKGGFICKSLHPGLEPSQRTQRVRSAYSAFIRALLDLTDNRIDGEVCPPGQLVRYDDDDAYLVVAADKGTASFSDLANGIAAEYGFWLGDAFASGGSQGYDHKKMGITARGAWESTRRLFRELGRDTRREAFSVAGIGDMSGDVFGNGMLLSRQIHLLAAFNHRHIFIDPVPDPALSFTERERLFRLEGSSWSDYDPALISPGGGVFSRQSKAIALTPAIRQALGISDELQFMSPDALIAAILRAPVDLLWNGGVGTYVRASDETDLDVGDRINDSLRIEASELRARVVVEGGNLGLTQRARIEFARRGGLINTDAIDNSAGVDCSDHEVNIKILLDQRVRAGQMEPQARDRLLEAMTDEVAALVLRNNYAQSKMLSQSSQTAPAFVARHAQLIALLEREGRLDRQLECLPDDTEIAARIARQEGLTRPEIAVLLAYSKSRLYDTLIDTDLITDPVIAESLLQYFPALLRDNYREDIESHPLRKEILAAQLTNQVINRMGSSFCLLLLEEVNTDCARWLRSYTVARDALGIADLAHDIDALDAGSSNRQQMELQLRMHHPVEKATRWLLKNADWSLDTAAMAARFRHAIDSTRPFVDAGVVMPQDVFVALETRVGQLEQLYAGFDIGAIAEQAACDVPVAVAAWYCVNEQLELNWVRGALDALPGFDRWQRRSREALAERLDTSLRQRVLALVQANPDCASLADFRARTASCDSLDGLRDGIAEIRSQPGQHLAMMLCLVNQLAA